MEARAIPMAMGDNDIAQAPMGGPQAGMPLPTARAPQAGPHQMSPSERQAWDSLTAEQQQQVPPDKMGSFLQMLMGNYGAEAQDAQQDMGRAEALRQDQRATGQTVGPDNIYVGASPLEHMADGIRGYQGMRDFKDAKMARNQAREDDATRREGLGEVIVNKSNILRGLFD